MSLTPNQAAEQAGSGDTVIGWSLTRRERTELLLQFPPRFDRVVADHVTLRTEAAGDADLPGEQTGEIVGRIDDGEGVEAMVVSIDGTTGRPGGGTYHITWSLAEGREARESNDVIAQFGWRPIDLPMPVILVPGRWSRTKAA